MPLHKDLTGADLHGPKAGGVVQTINTIVSAVATGTTALPLDDTIPQNSEGDQYMTLAITPTKATNKLKIDVIVNLANSGDTEVIAALFKDDGADAIAAASSTAPAGSQLVQIVFTHYMTAGGVAATTFKVRAGSPGGATTSFNGLVGNRQLGGVMASSITITEIEV